MIKVRVTHLIAPWPEGVQVGNVVALMADAIPAWALGKCEVAEEAAEPQFAWEPAPPAEPVAAELVALPGSPSVEQAVASAVAPMIAASEQLKLQMEAIAAAIDALRSALPAPKR